MPKLKTKKKAAKRFRKTPKGKILAKSVGRRHLMGEKTPKRIRQMRQYTEITGRQAKNIKAVLPYA